MPEYKSESPKPLVAENTQPEFKSDSVPKAANAWTEQAFIDEVAAAGFPDSPQTDEAWLHALYNFKAGGATLGAKKTDDKHEDKPVVDKHVPKR